MVHLWFFPTFAANTGADLFIVHPLDKPILN